MEEDEDDPVVEEADATWFQFHNNSELKPEDAIPQILQTSIKITHTFDTKPKIPVYLSHALKDQLYLFMYPTQPATLQQQDTDEILKCCFKPRHQELLMEFAVDPKNPNYDVSHGEQIAINVDGKNRPPSDRFFQSSVVDKRTMQSTKVLTDTSTMAVGVMKNRQLILSPLKGLLNIQPSFPHLDVTDKRAREEAKEMGEEMSGGEEEETEKQVTVKFARNESDRLKRAREQSYNYLSKKSAEERWYDTQYHYSNSRGSEVERTRLASVDLADQMSVMCLNPKQYLEHLVPLQEDPTWALPSLPAHTTSLTSLSSLPLPDIVSAILKEVKIMTFRQMTGLLAGQSDAVKLLRCVQQVATLVQGNWVVRSECLYPRESVSEHNGVPGEVMCRARDYILYQLSQGQLLERKQVAATVKLPTEELKELLSQVARLRRHRGWELVLPPDTDFIDQNPEVVERQARAWAAKYKQLMEVLEGEAGGARGRGARRRESSVSGGSDLESPARLRAPQSRHRKDSTRSQSSDAESGAETSQRRRRNPSDSVDSNSRKKRNSECGVEAKVTSKSRRTKSDMAASDSVS